MFAQNPIFKTKLSGMAVQSASAWYFTGFTNRTEGDSVILSATPSSGPDIDILKTTLKETSVQDFDFISDTLVAFTTSGPDAEGWVYLRAVLKNGGSDDIFRSKLAGTAVQDYTAPNGYWINGFTATTEGEYVCLTPIASLIGIEEDEHSEYEVNKLVFALDVSPNPAINSPQINYSIAKQCKVNLNVYDVTGRLVKTLINNQNQPANVYRLIWQADDMQGRKLSSGVYFVTFDAGDFHATKKILLLK
jgi:hypothetical protein